MGDPEGAYRGEWVTHFSCKRGVHTWGHGDTYMDTWVFQGGAYRGARGGTLLSKERTTCTSPAWEDYIHGGVAMVMGGDTYTSLAREDCIHFSRKGGLHTWRRGNGDEW